MSRVLQLCGRAPEAHLVPPDLGCERWIIGSAYHAHVGTAYTRVFDVHPLEETAWHHGIAALRPDAWAWYGLQDRPVYLIEPHPDVPTSLAYPRSRIGWTFGARAAQALSSTVDQMVALALLEGFTKIHEGFTTIHLCGVRMNSMEEWVLQRECLAYWIGRAESMGVEIITDPVAALCTPERVYGWGDLTGARRCPGEPVIVLGRPGEAAA